MCVSAVSTAKIPVGVRSVMADGRSLRGSPMVTARATGSVEPKVIRTPPPELPG